MFKFLAPLLVATATLYFATDASAQRWCHHRVVPSSSGPILHSTHYPSFHWPPPAIVTPNRPIGINHQTGGWDTMNSQIHHSAFDPYREMSKHNGSRRFVRRPVYNSLGQRVGYQQGWVWTNSVTGQQHANLQSYTPNSSGGVHQHNTVRSARRP